MRMKNKNYPLYLILLVGGILLIAGGLYYGKSRGENQLSSVATGIGIAIFGIAIGKLATLLVMTPEGQKKQDIDLKDERNVAIREKAAWKTNNIMITVLSVIGFALVFSDNLFAAILVVCAIMIQSVSIVVYSNYYSKKL